ncbi:hypothetical protein [Neolewinella persica]|uniref:hypothetical protein n=1 Tax=Neolewinella persica TaxID=70998 RepID=UPI000375D60E|nr:hypothetical protein [Neolewinella persica]
MDFNEQKKQWQAAGTTDASNWSAANLNQHWDHPRLRSLKRQLVFETVCWLLFLVLFYTGLDGHLKPVGWNVALAAGLVLLIAHGILGYRLAGRAVGAAPLRQALTSQLHALRRYSWFSMTLRTVTLLIFFGFLVSNVTGLLDTPRVWLVGTILIWTGVALLVNYLIWRKHFRELEATLAELGE